MESAGVHAESSARRWGVTTADAIGSHEKVDQTKSTYAELTRRCAM